MARPAGPRDVRPGAVAGAVEESARLPANWTGEPRRRHGTATLKILRIQPFDQLCDGSAEGQDPAMPRAPRRRGAPSRRLWAASATVAAALLGALVPAAQATGPAPSYASCGWSKKAGPPQSGVVAEILAAARSGVEVPPGAIDPPAATVGRPAQVLVSLGPDPLGIAAAVGADPQAFWGTARATVSAAGPGFTARAWLQRDASARLSFTAPEAGPVRMSLYVPGRAIQRALGLCPILRWGVDSPLVAPAGAPGDPVMDVEGLPVPPPNPGPEPAPVPGPEPAP
jgi:hypothetical protein